MTIQAAYLVDEANDITKELRPEERWFIGAMWSKIPQLD
jgi:hypothetical protein